MFDKEDERERIYESIFQNSDQRKPQFICATQPLALLLSRDSFLCFDGDDLGLYYPWRGVHEENNYENNHLDEEFKKFLRSKDAFSVPPIQEQRRLILLYISNIYPFYPVVDRKSLDDIKSIPLILLNAIFLSAIRFDSLQNEKDIRPRLHHFYQRCKQLELLETNKITLIQSYLLLSMHEEGINGATSSKEYVTKACNLCGELAITNISGSNGISMSSNQADHLHSSFKKVLYGKNFLRRLFWVSFCCDRLVSATCGREMYYNVADLMIDELTLIDFNEGEYQQSDYMIFRSWIRICRLIDRIQCSLYRPPKNRTTNDWTLEEDLFSFVIDDANLIEVKFQKFLLLSHAYVCILYLRSKVDAMSLMVNSIELSGEQVKSRGNYIDQIHYYSSEIVEIAESTEVIHHILVVHAIVHVIALMQLESKTYINERDKAKTNFGLYFSEMMNRCAALLERSRGYWWFAGSALRLCKVIFSYNDSVSHKIQ